MSIEEKRYSTHNSETPSMHVFHATHNAVDREVSYLLSAVIFVTSGAAFNCVLVNSAFFGA